MFIRHGGEQRDLPFFFGEIRHGIGIVPFRVPTLPKPVDHNARPRRLGEMIDQGLVEFLSIRRRSVSASAGHG
jgi:hypothetical protein